MSYCTVAMVRRALVPTLDEVAAENPPVTATRTAADFSNDQLQDAIDEAESTIDGMIGRIYTVPVADDPNTNATPHPIDYWCRNIASYNATLVYRGSLDFQDTDPIARRYRDTMSYLMQVSKGVMSLLGLVENTGPQSVTGVGSAINPYEGTLFTIDEFDLKPPNFDPVYGSVPRPFYTTP